MQTQENQLNAAYLNVNSLNPYPGTVSSSRAQMFGSHVAQKLVISGAMERYIQTGMEREFGKYTFSIKAPCDMKVLKTIDRYRDNVGPDSISMNPQTVVIYENMETKEVGVLDIGTYFSYHQYFGFAYDVRKAMSLLSPGQIIAKDTIFADSPAIGEAKGEYKYGIQLAVAYMSHPAVSEDGILISRDVLHRLSFKTYERRSGEWGSKRFPLNLYGSHSHFKAFPDIGERVRDDGRLMMFRSYDPLLAPVEQSIYDLCEPDYSFDETLHAPPGGKIIDIRVYKDTGKQGTTPELMDKQALKYANASNTFHSDIITEARKLERNKSTFSAEFHRMVVESLGVVDDTSVSKVQKLHRAAPLDEVRIEFVIEYETVPDIGFKLTDGMGGKAVICHIAEPHEMPVDEAGNRADVVMDGISTINRMNIGRLYEQYVNAASRDLRKRLMVMLGIPKEEKYPRVLVNNVAENKPELFKKAVDLLLGYYKIVSPKQYAWISEASQGVLVNHIGYVIKEFVYVYVPTDNSPELADMIGALEKEYKSTYGPVTYIGFSGNRVVTKSPVRIGSVYFMLLEKIGNDWSSVSSGRLHHFGFLAPVSRGDKYSEPIRNQPVRANGEAETRIIVATAGQRALAEVMDRNGSPISHQAVVESVLQAEQPTNIELSVDRNKVPLGGSKPLQLLEHITYCAGWTFKFVSSALSKLFKRGQ